MNLEEEIIWGHTVTPQTKKLWSIEIDLTKKLLEVCQKHSLKIWACYGTLIGAVRHKGFIPWDDDMDFVMFRDDYNELLRIAESEFSYPYFFQSIYTDAFWGGMARLRRSDTTMMESGYENRRKCNCGIWIDVFVLDGVPNNMTKYQNEKKKVKFLRRIVTNYMVFDPKKCSLQTKVKHAIISIICRLVNVKNIQRYIVHILSYNHISDCEKVAPIDMMSLWPTNLTSTKPLLDKKWFSETVWLPFHDILLPAPKDYDILLTTLYGDYMKPIKGTAAHTTESIDFEKGVIDADVCKDS